jgi:AmiR/NasT family two-component response regulator
MLTTEDQADMISRAKTLGANGWVVKPLKVDILVNTAKKLTAV